MRAVMNVVFVSYMSLETGSAASLSFFRLPSSLDTIHCRRGQVAQVIFIMSKDNSALCSAYQFSRSQQCYYEEAQ
jgi:hypothetical protein